MRRFNSPSECCLLSGGLLLFTHSVVSNSLQPCGLQHTRLPCLSLSPGILLKLMSIELVIPSNHLILCHPLLLLPSVFPSIRVFSSELAFLISWPKYWSLSFSISPSRESSELISLRLDWTSLVAQMVKNLPAVQETWVQSLGWEDPLEEGMATHSSILP